jgi:hypothetical protein
MKLYTEEQVKEMFEQFQGHLPFRYDLLLQQHLNQLKTIELPSETNIKDKLFDLANEFALSGYGKTAVILHSIHNRFDYNEKQ